MKRLVLLLISILAFALLWGTAFYLCGAFQRGLHLYPPPDSSTLALLAITFLLFGLPPLLAICVLLVVRPVRSACRTFFSRRFALLTPVALAILYTVTWVGGAPQVRATLRHDTLALHARILPPKGYSRMEPYIATRFVLPCLPGVLLSYHEYQIAPLNGLGGWYFHFWYGNGVILLSRHPTWIS